MRDRNSVRIEREGEHLVSRPDRNFRIRKPVILTLQSYGEGLFRLTARPLLTRFQLSALLGLGLLMLADLTISSWGVLFSPVFTEANALFAGFVRQPLEFIAVVGLSKLLVVAGLAAATVWFNRKERSGEKWHGGDIICTTAVTGMAAMMLVLVIGNLALW
jgi:hypothetical protein